MEQLTKSFDVFFESCSGVAVIRGDWGVGKTYYWDQYIKDRISSKDVKHIAYSYVSLFGKNSLQDIKSGIFQNAKAIASDETIIEAFEDELRKADVKYSRFSLVKGAWDFALSKTSHLGRLTSTAKKIPFLDKFSNLLSSAEYGFVNNYVVCFDDIERKGAGLSIKELMGLVDELAQRKSCKVVLIFNEKSFDKDGKDLEQFQAYREKVVDVELLYNPSCELNFSHVFSMEQDEFDFLRSIIVRIGVKNVRVLRKLKALIAAHSIYLENKSEDIKREFYLHAAVLCISYYTGDGFINYVDLRASLVGGSWGEYLSASPENLTPGQLAFKNINVDLQLSESRFDACIGDYLESGYVDVEAVKKVILELEERYRISSVHAKLRAAWSIYHDSFDDNCEEFKLSLKKLLNEDVESISLSDFSSAIEILDELGEEVDSYTEAYISARQESFTHEAIFSSSTLERVKNVNLKNRVVDASKASRVFNIDDITLKISKERSWDPEDISYLYGLTVQDFVDWLHSAPEHLTLKVRSGLLFFKGTHTANPDDFKMYASIGKNIENALRVVAQENALNLLRVKNMYGIDV